MSENYKQNFNVSRRNETGWVGGGLGAGLLGKMSLGCRAPVFDRKPLSKKNLLKNNTLASPPFPGDESNRTCI